MVQALRSHGWCYLVIFFFWGDVAIRHSYSNFVCDWLLITDSSIAPYDQKDLLISCQTFTAVDVDYSLAGAWTSQKATSSTIVSLHDITGNTYCLLLVPQTSNLSATTTKCGFNNTTSKSEVVVQSSSITPRISRHWLFVSWRHHLVMILCLSSQQNRFCDASKAREPSYRCQRIKE